MGRVLRGNARWVRALVGLPDQYSVDLANSMARATLTTSPMAFGAEGVSNNDLPGSGVNEFTGMTAPQQQFTGVVVAVPRRSTGDDLVSALPGDVGSNGSVAWMDLNKAVGARWGV